MPKFSDLTGRKFERLTVLKKSGKRGAKILWECICECGATHFATTSDLNYGSVKSCGCLLSGKTSRNARHGHSPRSGRQSQTYNSWRGMLDRCEKPNHISYPYYGGKGVTVCDRWKSFENFLSDMGNRPSGKTIDRINSDGNYEPSNCRWATIAEQNRNRKFSSQRRTAE